MKKIIFFTMMAIIGSESFSQQTTTLTKTDLFLKSKHQKKAAWIMLGGGVAATITGVVIYDNAYNKAAENDPFLTLFSLGTNVNPTGAYIFIAGTLSALGSIPLFITSSKNKRKALSLSFKNEKTPFLVHTNLVSKSFPAVSAKIIL